MNARKSLAIALVCISLVWITSLIAQTRRGTVPRSAATDYAAHASQDNVQIGASLLTHKDLKKVFATDVNECCLVVEVAFYPGKDPKDNKDQFVKISLDDFMLRETGMEIGTRPSTPDVLSARLEVQPVQPDREHRPGVSSGSDIGYERTTQQNGPERSTSGGVVQRSRVGVGIPIGGGGGSRLPEGRTAEGNRRAIEAELTEKALPETSAWEPVAGYLYFSVPKKKKGGYELVYMADDKKVVLPLK
jgi:hypothetical protein